MREQIGSVSGGVKPDQMIMVLTGPDEEEGAHAYREWVDVSATAQKLSPLARRVLTGINKMTHSKHRSIKVRQSINSHTNQAQDHRSDNQHVP